MKIEELEAHSRELERIKGLTSQVKHDQENGVLLTEVVLKLEELNLTMRDIRDALWQIADNR